ncbi:DUF1127 domain-containing protein [Wenxinia saemankumensis]|uniref:Uncharacterized conserved protein YjiS, DUF1127 family n=1 Tax=Wenxinia saemankumensis TaxID=1447782 RepID=A0A1M6ATA1_9RHOB|nr:DUF1127 domain-containing protein [Wenxinia saemankumensis]SHI39443.1 Uncharacterized conserved protein YjiS, DUF1127 family [Wenxinia saemankumensis]
MTARIATPLLAPAAAPRRPRALGYLALWAQRRALARLDTRALADIGLSRREAEIEATRPIWDVPAGWRA